MSDDLGDMGDFEQPQLDDAAVARLNKEALALIESSMMDISDVISDWMEDNADGEMEANLGSLRALLERMNEEQYDTLLRQISASEEAHHFIEQKVHEALLALIQY